jgi:peptide/nickel transport system ATP-binding protein
MKPLVEVQNLRVAARNEFGGETLIVKDVSFSIAPGEVVALIGESGSGKTTIALSVMGYARGGCRIAGGQVRIGNQDVLSLAPRDRARLCGREVAYIPQSAAAAFNPAKSLMAPITESALIHRLMSRSDAEAKARSLFDALALPDPLRIGTRYPHQVSGGQLQRLVAAMALLTGPKLLIFDEPTTALDVTTQVEVLRAFKRVVRERGATALYVSHDLAVVAQMADRIIVLRDGEIREADSASRIITTPQNDYTKSLMAAADPERRERRARPESSSHSIAPLLQAKGIVAGYGPKDREGRPAVPVLREIGFSLAAGATVGVVGESGSGKSTLARVLAGLLPPSRGSVELNGVPLSASLSRRAKEQLRQIQIVFQMADTALNPSQSVTQIIGRPLELYWGMKGKERQRRVNELLEMVKLRTDISGRYPGKLSGGQKQRVNLARALAARPAVILCDEVTSALDTVVGAAVLDLLGELQRELRVAYMFISHDLSTVRAVCDDMMILYAGQMMEFGGRNALRESPITPIPIY